MRVSSLAFDTLRAFDTKASSPKEAKQAPEASAKAEPAVLAEAAKSVQPPQELIVNGLGLGLSFTVDEPTGRSIIRVVDVETGEVIRQIPSDEALAFLQQMERQRGVLFSRTL